MKFRADDPTDESVTPWLQRARLHCAGAGVALLLAGCVITQTFGRFPDASEIGSQLIRGESTRQDVLRVLGPPAGSGGASLPPAHAGHEVWFYDRIQVGEAEAIGATIQMNIEQSILLVFVKDGVFDGYLWYSDKPKAEAVW